MVGNLYLNASTLIGLAEKLKCAAHKLRPVTHAAQANVFGSFSSRETGQARRLEAFAVVNHFQVDLILVNP